MVTPLQDLDPGFWTKTSWIQLGYGAWVSLTQLGIGLALGFQTVTKALPIAPNFPIEISSEDGTWLASVMSLSAPIGCLISGSVTDRLGRHFMLFICQLPMCIGWFYTAFASTATDILVGRIITGIGCGMATFPPRIYAAEISLPNMRGMVGSLPDVAIAFGITIQVVLGKYITWTVMCYLCGFYAVGMLIINRFIPETPFYVVMISHTDEVQRNLSQFRSSTYKIDDEVAELMEFKVDNDIRRLYVVDKLLTLVKRSSCQPLVTITAYYILGELSGVSIILIWTIEILTSSQSSVDPQKGNIILAATRLIAAIFTSMLLFKLGRRPMAITSAFGVTVVCFALGTYLYCKIDRNVVPQIFFIAYIIFASLGYYTLPQLMMAELYPLQIRGFLGGVSASLVYLVTFSTLKYYPSVKDYIGFANSIFLFGAFSLVGTMFLYFFLPETQTLTLQDIEEYYNNRRPTLVSQRRVKLIQLSMSSKLLDVKPMSSAHKNRSNINSKRIKDETLKLSSSNHSTSKKESSKDKTSEPDAAGSETLSSSSDINNVAEDETTDSPKKQTHD